MAKCNFGRFVILEINKMGYVFLMILNVSFIYIILPFGWFKFAIRSDIFGASVGVLETIQRQYSRCL